MTYLLAAIAALQFLALCGLSSRVKKSEEHIQIIRKALDAHLITGMDYRSDVEIDKDYDLAKWTLGTLEPRIVQLTSNDNGGAE